MPRGGCLVHNCRGLSSKRWPGFCRSCVYDLEDGDKWMLAVAFWAPFWPKEDDLWAYEVRSTRSAIAAALYRRQMNRTWPGWYPPEPP